MTRPGEIRPVAVIPARYGSTRFPGKPLALIAGMPMIEHVCARCRESGAFSRVIVATDDERIAAVASRFAEARMTLPMHSTGTDRIAEVARTLPEEELWVNVQGDEPAIHPQSLSQLATAISGSGVGMATLVRPLDPSERANPGVVKAVLTAEGDALYFSRADIPFQRAPGGAVARYAHLGLYAYRRETLLRLASLAPAPLEVCEQLEQLRALENGIRIRCLVSGHASVGVDTPADLAKAESLLRARV